MAGGDSSRKYASVGGKIGKPMPIRSILPKLSPWMFTAATFGASVGVLFLYVTDWKVFMNKVPFYNTKFDTTKESVL